MRCGDCSANIQPIQPGQLQRHGMEPNNYNRDILELLLQQNARKKPELPKENAGAGGRESEPESAGIKGLHAKVTAPFTVKKSLSEITWILDSIPGLNSRTLQVVSLPGRQANLRRLQLWRSHGSNRALFDVCLRACNREVGIPYVAWMHLSQCSSMTYGKWPV